MKLKNIEGFFSSPFFAAVKTDKYNPDGVKEELKNLFDTGVIRENDYFFVEILGLYYSKENQDYSKNKDDYISICKECILEQLSLDDAIKYFVLNDEENKKVLELIARRQFNAKLLKMVLLYFIQFREYIDLERLYLILRNELLKKIHTFKNNLIISEIGDFKKCIDSITSGIKLECYLDFMCFNRDSVQLEKSLLDNIYQYHGYNLNDENYYGLIIKSSLEKVLSNAIYPSNDFWFNDGNKKSVYYFLNLVLKYNGIKHVMKIVDYMFEQICKTNRGKYIYEHKLPLVFLDNLEDKLINSSIERIQNKLNLVLKFDFTREEANGLIYPIHSNYEVLIKEGEDIFKCFIKTIYSTESDFVMNLFSNLDNIIRDEIPTPSGISKRKLTLHEVLEFDILGHAYLKQVEEYLSGFYGRYSENELVLKRFYYRIYLITKHSKGMTNECLYEVFFDLFDMINNKFNLKCEYRMNNELRNKSYDGLKKLLKEYNFEIDDKYKSVYICALLDRKHATLDEIEIYTQLEQLGDAIYELAVSNIFFYNDKTKLDGNKLTNYVNSNSQVIVSKKIGIDKLYISKLVNTLNLKYLIFERADLGAGYNDKHYLADALEMLIAAISREFGIQKALDFATRIIIDTFSNLQEPNILKFDLKSLYKGGINRTYLDKIFPAPFTDLDNSQYSEEYCKLSNSIQKLLLVNVLGNDSKEKRNFITNNLYSQIFYKNSELSDTYNLVRTYLYLGIDKTIEIYSEEILSYYNNLMKK